MKREEIQIGLKFKYYGQKHNNEYQVVDMYTTTNSLGQVVGIEYLAEQLGSLENLGQKILKHFPAASIVRSEIIN